MIDLSSEELRTIRDILKKHASDYKILAFGSRVTGQAKKFSDLDMALIGPNKIPVEILSTLKEVFAESNLPFEVDIVDWNRISPEFQKLIEKNFIEI